MLSMKLTHTQLLILMFAFLASMGMLHATAQTTPTTVPLFHVTIDPELSYSGTPVTVTIVPENFSVSTTSFSWFRNNTKLGSSGMGKNKITLTTDPAPSALTQLRVDIDPGSGFSPATQTISIETLRPFTFPTSQNDAIKSDFNLEVTSANPDPGETVTVSVVTYSFDKQFAMYRWYINDKFESGASGKGRFNFQLRAGRDEEITTIRVDVVTPDGLSNSKSVVIQVTSAPLYWWADTNTPYWYRGKALPSLGSNVHVIVLPNTTSPLSYRWEFNNNFIQQASGVDRPSFTYKATFPVKEHIRVLMSSPHKDFSKQAEIEIEPSSAMVSIYKVQPLQGVMFEHALGELVDEAGSPFDFLAIPFFFSRERIPDLAYTWTLNGKIFSEKYDTPWLFTLTSNPGETSSNSLSVQIKDQAQNGREASQTATIKLH